MLNPNTQCDHIRRWGLWEWSGHEVEPSWVELMSGELPPPCHPVRIQWKDSPVWTGKSILIRHYLYQCLDFGLPSLQICRKDTTCFGVSVRHCGCQNRALFPALIESPVLTSSGVRILCILFSKAQVDNRWQNDQAFLGRIRHERCARSLLDNL